MESTQRRERGSGTERKGERKKETERDRERVSGMASHWYFDVCVYQIKIFSGIFAYSSDVCFLDLQRCL